MADRLKVLQFTQNEYRNMGFSSIGWKQNLNSINWRKIAMLVSLIYYVIFSLSFLIFEAKSITEVGISFFTVTTVVANLMYVLINMISNMPKIENLTGNFEVFIDNRKSIAFKNSISLNDLN